MLPQLPNWNSTLEESFQKAEAPQMVAGARLCSLLATVLFPAFAVVDWFSYPEHFWALTKFRFAATAVFAISYLVSWSKNFTAQQAYGWNVAMLHVAAVTVTLMCLKTGGWESSYYAGINLLVLAATVWMQTSAQDTAYTVLGVVSVYVFGIYVKEGLLPADVPYFINNVAFILGTSLIGLAGVHVVTRTRRESYLRLLQAQELPGMRASRDEAQGALEIRDEFISIASHELKTPITSMKLQNDILKRQIQRELKAELESGLESGPSRAKSERFAQWIERNEVQLMRLIRLIDDMLDISRINTGRLRFDPERFDVSALVSDLCDRFQPQFNAVRIRLHEEIAPDIHVHADRMRIEQVISNLLSNTAKYAPEADVIIRVKPVAGQAVIEVEDHGIGIDPIHHERIFQRFERATAISGLSGLGLGLYISRKIMEGHCGRISVQSERGRGATFRVELPMENAAMAQVGLTRESPVAVDGDIDVETGRKPL